MIDGGVSLQKQVTDEFFPANVANAVFGHRFDAMDRVPMAVHINLICENFVGVSAIFMSAAKSTGTILVFGPQRLAQNDSLVARFGSVDPMSDQGVFVDEFPLAPGALWGQGPFDIKVEGFFINRVVRIVLHVVGPSCE